MVRDYVETLYSPSAVSAREVDGPGYELAVNLATWKARVTQAWSGVRVDHVETSPSRTRRSSVRSSACACSSRWGRWTRGRPRRGGPRPGDDNDRLVLPAITVLEPAEAYEDGRWRYEGDSHARAGRLLRLHRPRPAAPRPAGEHRGDEPGRPAGRAGHRIRDRAPIVDCSGHRAWRRLRHSGRRGGHSGGRASSRRRGRCRPPWRSAPTPRRARAGGRLRAPRFRARHGPTVGRWNRGCVASPALGAC